MKTFADIRITTEDRSLSSYTVLQHNKIRNEAEHSTNESTDGYSFGEPEFW